MIKKIALPFYILITVLLTGCMYSGNEEEQPAGIYAEQIESVQRGVSGFQESSGGLLPIKTREANIDLYIKYPIDFSKLVPAHMEKIPSNAYEKGGVYQYVLYDVEDNPTVKLVDIRFAERIRELNLRKNMNNGSIPFKDEVGEAVYEIDYDKMGITEALTVPSPYSDTHLPLVVAGDGHFYVDYSIELQRVLEEQQPDVQEGDDIRYLLIEDSPVLPAYSLPYTVNENNEPVYMKK